MAEFTFRAGEANGTMHDLALSPADAQRHTIIESGGVGLEGHIELDLPPGVKLANITTLSVTRNGETVVLKLK